MMSTLNPKQNLMFADAKVHKSVTKMNIRKEYLDNIRNGRKTVEGRVASETYRNINCGEVILFCCDNDQLERIVGRKTLYKNFKEMLETEGVNNCLPGVNDVEEGVRIYQGFPGYLEQEKKTGVVAFKLLESN